MSDTKKAAIREKQIKVRQALLDFVTTLDEAQWQTAVFAEDAQWTVADLFRHVVDAERGMLGLMVQIQQGNNPVPPDFDLARWNNRVIEKAKDKPPAQLIAEMEKHRANLMAFLDSVQEDDWAKKGRHASLRILSIEEICHLIADHEQSHLQDMQNALAAA